jgi:hypothetical protein
MNRILGNDTFRLCDMLALLSVGTVITAGLFVALSIFVPALL